MTDRQTDRPTDKAFSRPTPWVWQKYNIWEARLAFDVQETVLVVISLLDIQMFPLPVDAVTECGFLAGGYFTLMCMQSIAPKCYGMLCAW